MIMLFFGLIFNIITALYTFIMYW